MATRMSRPDWEKAGACAWAQCARCSSWFPVAPALLEADGIDLVCPGCNAEFCPADAQEIIAP